ncbi:MAG: DUF421 domain-containing protein [Clostridia bacterium]|nr:DUF421 domain-containing protein [Clostridia bacterium]
MNVFGEVLYQTILAYCAILLYARILGKQQVAQLTPYDYINGITFGSIAGALAADTDPTKTVAHLTALTLFALITFGAAYLSLKSRPARKLLEGEPTIVVHNGKILEQNMAKMRYNMDDLLMQLRAKNVFNLSDVEYAVSEPNGALSILLKTQKQPVTAETLGIPTQYQGISSELIMDGDIIQQNLIQNNLDLVWLQNQLRQQGILDPREVAYAALDTSGKLYVDKKQDDLMDPTDLTDKDR